MKESGWLFKGIRVFVITAISVSLVMSGIPTQAMAEAVDGLMQEAETQQQESSSVQGQSESVDNIASGTCGTCSWVLDSTGTLDIGPGRLASVSPYYDRWPWYNYRDQIEAVKTSGTVQTNGSIGGLFFGCTNLKTIDLSNWDTSSLYHPCESKASSPHSGYTFIGPFYGCSSLTTLDLSGWDVSKVDRADCLFEGLSALKNLDLSGWDTASLTSVHKMFADCSSLESLDLSNWDTSSVIDMRYTFSGCSSLKSLDLSGWDTSSVNHFDYMFNGCSSLEYLNVSHFDTSSITGMTTYIQQPGMSHMFSGCSSLKSLDLSGFDVSSVEGTPNMFANCSSLTALDLDDWTTAALTDMSYMFSGCSSLPSLDLSSFDTSNVKYMYGMFRNCSSLSSINCAGWDTSSVVKMGYNGMGTWNNGMFSGCSSIKSLDLSNWDVSSVTDMYSLFSGCTSLESLNLSGWDVSSVTTMHGMFRNCRSLENLDLSSWNTSSVTDMGCMFENCSGLKQIFVGSHWLVEQVSSSIGMFSDCTSLTGGNGTVYNPSHVDASYAVVDTVSTPGYMTASASGENEKDLSKAKVYINGEHSDRNVKVKWTGYAIEPEISVQLNNGEPFGIELTRGVDYDVTFFNNIEVGTATIVIAGKGEYAGSRTVQFTIAKESVSSTSYIPSRNGWGFSSNDVSVSRLSRSAFNQLFPNDTLSEILYNWKRDKVEGGLCEGIAISSALSFINKPSLDSWGKNGATMAFDFKKNDLKRRSSGGILLSEYIQASWCYQYTLEANKAKYNNWSNAANGWAHFDEILDKTESFNKTGLNPIVIVIRGPHPLNPARIVGHDLVPYRIERGINTDLVYVYDCNALDLNENPDEQYIELQKDSRGNYTGWSYELWPGLTWKAHQLGSMITYYDDFSQLEGLASTSDFTKLNNGRTIYFTSTGTVTVSRGGKLVFERGSFVAGDVYDFVPVIESNAFEETPVDSGLMWYCNTDTESSENCIEVSELDEDTEITGSSSTGGVSVRASKGSVVRLSVSEDARNSASVIQENGGRFEVTYFEELGSDNADEIYISGLGSEAVTTMKTDDGIETSGVTELIVHNADGESTHVVHLDENAAYTIYPGDEKIPPEVICEKGESLPAFDQRVVAVAAGSAHAAAILEDGSLWTWGDNDNGQLGDGTYEDKLSPVKVMDDVVGVSLGVEHSAAIRSDGSLWTWGRNKYGSLGDGTTTSRPSPVKVMEGVSQVSCGNGTTAALKDDGTLWVWGFVGLDGLGIGEPGSLYDYLSEPVQLASGVSSVSLGGNEGSYITASGELFAWGAGATTGSVGTGSKENVYEPTKILDGVVSASMNVTSAAVKADGSLWIWGYQPGVYEPTRVLDGVSSASAGFNFVVAQMRDGSLQTYGVNDHGQLGNGSEGSPSASFSKVCDGMAMSDAGTSFGMSVNTDGTLYTWGYNNHGQLGTGTTESIATVTATVSGSSAPLTQASTIDISSATITGLSDVPYTGSFATQPIVVTLDGKTLEEGWDYSVDYGDGTEIGEASVTVRGKGVYTGTVTASFNVTAADISDATVSEIDDQVYNGAAVTPAIRVRMNGQTLSEGEDYTLEYSDNVNAGTAAVRIVGMGNYCGEKEVTFGIAKAEQTVTVSDRSVPMGKTVALGAKTSGDGTLTYKSSDTDVAKVSASGVVTPVSVGAAEITIMAAETANYKSATMSATVTVVQGTQSVTASNKSVAMGETVSLGAKASAGGKLTYKSSNTAVAKVNSKGIVTPVKVGTAKITITASKTANYKSATKTVTVTVTQGKQTISASNKTVGVKKSVSLAAKTSGDGKLTYKSSNTSVATVSAKGVVTGRKVGTAKITITAAGTTNYKKATKTVTITVKKTNTLTAKAKAGTLTASLKTLKTKTVTLASNITVSNAKGSVSYSNASSNATAKKFKVNAKTGKVSIPKGTKKGKYQVKIKVTAAGNNSYLKGSKTITFYIQVK